jgi:hypothetical protein
MKFFLQALFLTSVSVSITTANDDDVVTGENPSTPRNQMIQVQTPKAPKKETGLDDSPTTRKLFDDSDSDVDA